MNAGPAVHTRSREALIGVFLVLVAMSVAMVAGYTGVSGVPVLIMGVAAAGAAVMLSQVFAGYLVMVANLIVFICVPATPTSERYLNVFDFILPLMFPIAFFGMLRKQAKVEEKTLEQGEAHEKIRAATHRLSQSVIWYYALATVSLIQIAIRLGLPTMVLGVFMLGRTVQGLLMFPLGMWWIRSKGRIDQCFRAAFVGGAVLVPVMLYDRIVVGTTRPGTTWVLNQPEQITQDANGSPLAFLYILTFILSRGGSGLSWIPMGIAGFTALIVSQSRSSILCLGAFLMLNIRRIPVRLIFAGALLAALAVALAPHDFMSRMAKTIAMERGSPELYSWLIRVYGFKSNWDLFLDNWLFGVGFFSGQHHTRHYNELGLPLGSENYLLETAVGLGIIGVVLFILVMVRVYQLGTVIKSVVPQGSIAYRMAQLHGPLLLALQIPNLVGTSWAGTVAHGQMALWCALMVRAAHLSLRDQAAAKAPAAQAAT